MYAYDLARCRRVTDRPGPQTIPRESRENIHQAKPGSRPGNQEQASRTA